MFVLADPYVFRPLPYARAHELAVIHLGSGGRGGGPPEFVPTLDDWRSRADLFNGVAAYTGAPDLWIQGDAGRTSLTVLDVTENLLEVLEVPGRLPPAPTHPDAPEVPVVLTVDGRRTVPGDQVATGVISGLHGGPFRITGVLPERVLLPGPRAAAADALSTFKSAPLRTVDVRPNGGYSSSRPLTVIARLRPGVTPTDVSDQLREMMRPEVDYQVRTEWLAAVMTRDVRPLALGALAAATLVLLVCAGNVANLLAARDAWRTREFATRQALGASRADVFRLRLFELAAIGGVSLVVGLGLAGAALAVCARVIPAEYVTLGQPRMTWRAALAAAIGAGVVVVTALVPLASSMTRVRTSPTTPSDGRGMSRLRVGLLVMQSAFALVLSVGAAMLVQSYWNLAAFDLGLDRTALTVSASPATLPGQSRRATRPLDVVHALEAMKRIPGVRAVSAGQNSSRARQFVVNGSSVVVFFEETMPGFLEAMGMRIRRGRTLTPGDEQWRAIVVNEAFVRAHWPGDPGLGRMVRRDEEQAQVVGVVGDVQEFPFHGSADPTIYSLVTEIPGSVRYALNVSGDPRAHVAAVRRTLGGAHPEAAIGSVETVGGQLLDRVRNRTFAMVVLTFFAVAAVVVTIAGLAGLVGFLVARRTREIAIRLALGARPAHIRRLVARDALGAACAGALTGLLLGRWLSTWLESLVFGIEAGNWTTTLVAACAAVALMVLPALVPAHRALRLQPTEALRVE
jgi:predicted permease